MIVPARDAEATLPAALDSVLVQDHAGALEVTVADGSETPATRELVRRRFPQVRLVPNPEREIPSGLNRRSQSGARPQVNAIPGNFIRATCHGIRSKLAQRYLSKFAYRFHRRVDLATSTRYSSRVALWTPLQ